MPIVEQEELLQAQNPRIPQSATHNSGERNPSVERSSAVETGTETSLAAKDPRYTEIGCVLPSEMIFYPFDTLSIRPLNLLELKKLYQANKLESTQMILETLSSTMDQSAFRLTEGDFKFIMYWLRINSYKRMTYSVKVTCNNPEHIAKVQAELEDEDTLETEIKVSTVANLTMEPVKAQEVVDFVKYLHETYEIYVTTPRMGIIVDFENLLEDLKAKSPKKRPLEDSFLASLSWDFQYASLLDDLHGVTLKEKLDFWKQFSQTAPTDVVCDLDEFRMLSEHGVSEIVKSTCGGCGADIEAKVSIQAPNFFPGIQ